MSMCYADFSEHVMTKFLKSKVGYSVLTPKVCIELDYASSSAVSC
jgi:hypothetical protein